MGCEESKDQRPEGGERIAGQVGRAADAAEGIEAAEEKDTERKQSGNKPKQLQPSHGGQFPT